MQIFFRRPKIEWLVALHTSSNAFPLAALNTKL